MYTLFFDTDCDVTPEIAKEYGAKLISMPYEVEGVEYKPYVSWDKYNAKELCDKMRKGVLPSTSALSPEDYKGYIEPEFAAGKDVLYVHFSASMSATFNSLRLALEELKEKYPERKCDLIDTKGITLGSLALCMEIGKLYKAGKSVEEIKKWAEENVDKQAFYFFADNLKFFAKSGRVSGFKAFMGGIIGIKPIICIPEDGKMTSIDKAKGRKNALLKILDYMIKLQDHIQDYPIIIAHGDAQYLVDEMIPMIKQEFGENLNIIVEDVNPTAVSHCGPDVLGVTFHAKARSVANVK